MLLSARRLASLTAAGLSTISVSLDGLAEPHDALRLHPGGFGIVGRALERLVADPFWRPFRLRPPWPLPEGGVGRWREAGREGRFPTGYRSGWTSFPRGNADLRILRTGSSSRCRASACRAR
jgi:hypothetical protein